MFDRFVEWIALNVWLIVAIVGGIIVSIVTSEDHNIKTATGRIACGLFFAIVFPNPVLTLLERDPAVYGNATAGLLAMTGYAIAKFFSNSGPTDWINAWRGHKK